MRYSVAKLARVQRRRLEKLVRFAIARSPFYRRKFASVDPKRFALADLPVTTKDQIRGDFDSVVTDPRVRLADLQAFIADDANLGRWFAGKYAVCQTSGSQGAPLVIVQHRRCVELIFALMAARSSPKTPNALEGIRRLLRPNRVAAISFRRGFYPSGMAMEFMPQVMGRFVEVTRLASGQPDLVERLNELQPDTIAANASVLEALAMHPERLRLPGLRYLTSSSEELSQGARLRIDEALQAPVYDHYGAGECLQLADSCRQCRKLHINADWVIAEVVDDDYRPVPAGETGTRLLVTNLANYAQPFIRYEIADRIALAATHDCAGNPLPQIEKIEGRASDLLCVSDGNSNRYLSGIMFHTVFSAMRVREWRVIQPERNRLEILLQLLDPKVVGPAEAEEQLRGRLQEFGLPDSVAVDVRYVDELKPDERTGKMRRIINEVGRPEPVGPGKLAAVSAE